MNTFSGKGRIGFIAVFAILLMPLLSVSYAQAYEVGDQVWISVPELSEIVTQGPTLHQFTCRAVSDHAYWFVQDTSCVSSDGELIVPHSTDPDSICWDNIIDQEELDQMVAEFEGMAADTIGADIWNKVTSLYGTPVDVDDDPRVWMVMATIPTKYQPTSPGASPTPRNNMYWVDPAQYEEGADDPHDMVYVNIGVLASSPSFLNIAKQLRPWNMAVGLAAMTTYSINPDQEEWLVNGISEVAQNYCYGFTSTAPGSRGQSALVKAYAEAPFHDMLNPTAGAPMYGYVEARATGFMWFMYLMQRLGDGIIADIVANEYTGMEGVANAIDPSVPAEEAFETNVYPLYMDWLIAATASYLHLDYPGGIYQYDFLVGTPRENFTILLSAGPGLSRKFTEYPFDGWIARPPGGDDPALPSGMIYLDNSAFAAQFISFADAGAQQTVYFNGMYSDGSGSGSPINGKWIVRVLQINPDETISVEYATLDDFYNGSFNIGGEHCIAAVTNNNYGGTSGLRYYLSQDNSTPNLITAAHLNAVNTQYIDVYCTFQQTSGELTGFDWVGPGMEAQLGDSTSRVSMSQLYGSIYKGVFNAWDAGTYTMQVSGYDSVGMKLEAGFQLTSGFVADGLTLELDYASLFVPEGGAPSGSMIIMADAGPLTLAMESATSVSIADERMTGVVAGPVSISNVNGIISFSSSTNSVAVYRYTSDGWVELDSWRQNGKVSANITEGGIYALGQGIGAFAPELPAQLVLGANAPNPFSAQTAISFGLPVEGNVRVNVFDMSGRLVNTLANEEMAAANHTLIWDGTDMNGNTLGTGVYFCRLEAAGQVLTQKMLKIQ